MPIPDAVKQTLGKALGRVPSGVYVVTAKSADTTQAMLASWIQQAGFEPPMITLAMARDRSIAPLIRRQKQFVVSILAEDAAPIMKKYARGIAPGQDPFDNLKARLSPAGIPYLADALGFLECQLVSICESPGDHDIFLAHVIAGELLRDGQPFKHIRGNGFHY